MSELFNNVKVGDLVHYLTPQGQNGKGKVVIKHESGSHVVVNRGKGQPQVVNDRNYVKHERGGKVLGALLSRVAQYDKNAKSVVKEDSKDVGGAAERVEKTKKHSKKKMNEVSAPGKEDWIKANKARFIERYGKEKGTKILYAKAWKDAKNESVVNEQPERAGKARAAERSWASDLADKSPNLAKGAGKPEPGYHYRVGGKTVSVHQHPQDALSAYKKGGSTGKIVHVKEGVETDVTTKILSEAKMFEAAKKAVANAKKAKGNNHVDTEPALNIQDRGTTGPIEGNNEQEGASNAPVQ